MKTNTKTYVIGHFGRKGTVVATMEIIASSKVDALEKYLKVYTKQDKKNCVFVEMPQAQDNNKARKAKAQPKAEGAAEVKAQPKAESKPTKTVEPKAKAKAKKSEAKPETVAIKATVVKPTKSAWKAELKALKSLDGIETYIERDWLWVKGDTRQHHDKLMELGFRWSKKRQEWCKMPVKAKKVA